jgi:SAM-dependent methyltransferase
VYETDVALNEYLQFHYATDAELCPFVDADAADVEPRYAQALRQIMSFPVVCADTLADAAGVSRPGAQTRGARALDVGCSVGRTSFELTRHFDRVVGLDFSHTFVDAANRMKAQGSLPYARIVSGDVVEGMVAAVPAALGGADARARVSFQQGDACALDVDALGGPFTGVVAANLLCRLPEPLKFLTCMREVVAPGGTLVLISPCVAGVLVVLLRGLVVLVVLVAAVLALVLVVAVLVLVLAQVLFLALVLMLVLLCRCWCCCWRWC